MKEIFVSQKKVTWHSTMNSPVQAFCSIDLIFFFFLCSVLSSLQFSNCNFHFVIIFLLMSINFEWMENIHFLLVHFNHFICHCWYAVVDKWWKKQSLDENLSKKKIIGSLLRCSLVKPFFIFLLSSWNINETPIQNAKVNWNFNFELNRTKH